MGKYMGDILAIIHISHIDFICGRDKYMGKSSASRKQRLIFPRITSQVLE